MQSTEVEASESREATRDEKSLSHQDSLQLKPLFRNRDCAHETRQEQLLPLVFRRRRFSLRCLCFGCWCAGAAGPCHLQQVGVALDCAHSLSNDGRPWPWLPTWY